MDRRGFLHGILALGVAPAIVRIGNLMPVKSIILPSTEEVIVIAGNTLLSIDMITREALQILHKNIGFFGVINKSYEEDFSKGDTIRIIRPQPYTSLNEIVGEWING